MNQVSFTSWQTLFSPALLFCEFCEQRRVSFLREGSRWRAAAPNALLPWRVFVFVLAPAPSPRPSTSSFFPFFPLRPQVRYLDPGLSGRSPCLQQALGHPHRLKKNERDHPFPSPTPAFFPPSPNPSLATMAYRQQPSFDGSTHELHSGYQSQPYGGGGAGYQPEPSRYRGGAAGASPLSFAPPLFFLGPKARRRPVMGHGRSSNVSTACRSSVRGNSDECLSGPRFYRRSADVGWLKEDGRGGRREGQGSSRLRVLFQPD